MRLISLTANKPSFRTVQFNETGVTLIVARQKNPESADSTKTYNGVGKSLAITLIHFCLASNKKPEFETAIPGWEFTLTFKIGPKTFVSTRNTSSQDKILLNNEEMSLAKFKTGLQAELFSIPEHTEVLSFRTLLPRFVRPRKSSYVSFYTVRPKEREYESLLCCGFLLGLDTKLITEKCRLKKERDRIDELRGNLSKDTIFLEFFTGNKNVDIELIDLTEEIARLERELQNFQIAENYHDLEKQADQTKWQLQEKKNRRIILGNAVENINASLKTRPDIAPDKLVRLYEEARAKLPEAVVKEIGEVADFHNTLIANRTKRLMKEKSRLENEMTELQKAIDTLSKSLDAQLQFLNAHGALDEYTKLSNHLNDLKGKAQKIRDYKELLQKYSNEAQAMNIALSNETLKTTAYLKESHPVLDSNFEMFRSLAKKFYPTKPAGLTVENNEGENQIRFNISARIQDDASDGINEVKMFCFDLTLLLGRHNHKVDFVFHDSRLFSDIDARQRAILFKTACELSKTRGVQYVASVNEDQLVSMRDQFSESEYKEVITDKVTLELTDDSDAEKLLGIQVDMKHEGED
jgi:uncharacterized protein YydD (DUF2326 family)